MPFTKCPLCGYQETNPNLKFNNAMNKYVKEDDNKVVVVMNSAEDKIQTENGVFIREDLVGKKSVAEPAKVTTQPVATSAPAAPAPTTSSKTSEPTKTQQP
jgi:hypothetical protein